jgi:hypothetical protein
VLILHLNNDIMKTPVLLFAVIGLCFFQNSISTAQNSDWLWARSAGGTYLDFQSSVAVDYSGNAYVTGRFLSSSMTFGPYTLINTNAGSDEVFLAKYDAGGNILWAKSFGGISSDDAHSIAVDVSGNVYVAGSFFDSTLIIGSDTLTNNGVIEAYLAKFDANGNVLWAKGTWGTGYNLMYSVAVDASGNAYVTGGFQSATTNIGSFSMSNPVSNYHFLAKYDANGNVLWAKSVGGIGGATGQSVALDASGNAYATGSFSSPGITLDSYNLTSAGGNDVFLAKHDTSGNVLWARSVGGTKTEDDVSVGLDDLGNAYLTGNSSSPLITFDSITLTNTSWRSNFLAKYDANGNVLWAELIKGIYGGFQKSIAVDATGDSFVTSIPIIYTKTLGSSALADTGSNYVFITKYAANGSILWERSVRGLGSATGETVALDVSGNVYLTGSFSSPTITFGSDTLTNLGSSDVFIAKLSALTGISELNTSKTVFIFPNPATDNITIRTSQTPIPSQLSIMNVNGKVLLTRKITEPKTTIDVSTLPGGVYFVRLVGAGGVQVGKFVKE